MELNLVVRGQRLFTKTGEDAVLVSHYRRYVTLSFEYDDMWQGMDSVLASFEDSRHRSTDGSDYVVEVRDGKVDVPAAIAESQRFTVKLAGRKGEGTIVTTSRLMIYQDDSGGVTGLSKDYPQSTLEEFYRALSEKVSTFAIDGAESIPAGDTPFVENVGTDVDVHLVFKIPRGDSIVSIERTGLDKEGNPTYDAVLETGERVPFVVPKGVGVESIEYVSTEGTTLKYRVNMTEGDPIYFEISIPVDDTIDASSPRPVSGSAVEKRITDRIATGTDLDVKKNQKPGDMFVVLD